MASFLEEARRRQIIDATVRVLAREGYAKASLSRIAGEAGISKSIISYHFSGKDDLFEQVFHSVAAKAEAAITPHMEAANTPRECISAYVRQQIRYMRDHRDELIAIGLLAINHGGMQPPAYITEIGREEQTLFEDLFREGQADGSFRSFDTAFMARLLSKAIEAALEQWARHPETDLDACAEELISLFERGIGDDRAV